MTKTLVDVHKSISSKLLRTRASAKQQETAGGRRPEAFICFEVFGTRDEAYSLSVTKMRIQVFDLR